MTPTDPGTEELVRRINDQQFDPVRLRPGYEMGAVDDLLDRVVAALRAGAPTPSLLAEPLDVVRFREAYAVESVDPFLTELSEILSARQVRMAAEPAAGRAGSAAGDHRPGAIALVERIDQVRLIPTREGRRYDMREVDQLLGRVRDAVLAGDPVRPLLTKPPKVEAARKGYGRHEVEAFLLEVLRAHGEPAQLPFERADPVNVIQEQQSLWQRLLGPE